jgi:maltose alpha-D-glucosyltransferase/alpha-amylase
MLRSYSYAAAVFAKSNPESSPWLGQWEEFVSQSYLDSYFSARQSARTATVQLMLRAFTLEKALYELQYELDHRPTWASVPLRGILDLLAKD